MKATLQQIVEADGAVAELMRLTDCPPVTKFRILGFLRAYQTQLKHFTEVNNLLVLEIGGGWKDKNGQVGVPPEKRAEFNARRQELLNEKVDLGDIREMNLPASCPLSPMAFSILEPFGVHMIEPKEA